MAEVTLSAAVHNVKKCRRCETGLQLQQNNGETFCTPGAIVRIDHIVVTPEHGVCGQHIFIFRTEHGINRDE